MNNEKGNGNTQIQFRQRYEKKTFGNFLKKLTKKYKLKVKLSELMK